MSVIIRIETIYNAGGQPRTVGYADLVGFLLRTISPVLDAAGLVSVTATLDALGGPIEAFPESNRSFTFVGQRTGPGGAGTILEQRSNIEVQLPGVVNRFLYDQDFNSSQRYEFGVPFHVVHAMHELIHLALAELQEE